MCYPRNLRQRGTCVKGFAWSPRTGPAPMTKVISSVLPPLSCLANRGRAQSRGRRRAYPRPDHDPPKVTHVSDICLYPLRRPWMFLRPSAYAMTRVTQGDIARAAGVHNATVSLALRNHPAIPEATRKRIQAVAAELGYFPDPALQALVAYRRGKIQNRRQETLAYITGWHSKWGWQDDPVQARYHAGARRKAAELGFHLEHFWLGEPGLTQRRLNSVLFHRSIRGVLLAAQRPNGEPLREIGWDQFSAVVIGSFPSSPPLHRVIDDNAAAMRQAFRRTRAAGYDRIGLVVSRNEDDLTEQTWSTSFLAEQTRCPHNKRVPALVYRGTAESAALAFQAWYERHRPEAIVSTSSVGASPAHSSGLCVPSEAAWVNLRLETADGLHAGVLANCDRVGELAAEMLVGHVQRNLRGLPSVPTTTLVDAVWADGDSLPVQPLTPDWQRRAVPSGYADDALLIAP